MNLTSKYYGETLKTKTRNEVLTVIRGLKQKIGKYKNLLENPLNEINDKNKNETINQIYLMRKKLNVAMKVFKELGGTYELSVFEKRIADFENNLNDISRLVLDIGSYFDGYKRYSIVINDNSKVYVEKCCKQSTILNNSDIHNKHTKESLLKELESLAIGEWRKIYSANKFDYVILDGTQWDLTIEYSNGSRPFNSHGSNSFPYNFDKFLSLFGNVSNKL